MDGYVELTYFHIIIVHAFLNAFELKFDNLGSLQTSTHWIDRP